MLQISGADSTLKICNTLQYYKCGLGFQSPSTQRKKICSRSRAKYSKIVGAEKTPLNVDVPLEALEIICDDLGKYKLNNKKIGKKLI